MAGSTPGETEKLIEKLARLATGDTLMRVVATATIGANGALGPVGGVREKLFGLFHPDDLKLLHDSGQLPPRVVAVCAEQQDLLGLPGIERFRTHNGWLRLVAASNIDELVQFIGEPWLVDGDSLQHDIHFHLNRHSDFVGRTWLFSRLTETRAAMQGETLLVTADEGIGKSAFAAQCLATDPSALYYFFERGRLTDPHDCLRALTAMVALRYGLPRDHIANRDEWQRATLESMLEHHVGPQLEHAGATLLIVVDGLDASLQARDGSRIFDLLPLRLPARVPGRGGRSRGRRSLGMYPEFPPACPYRLCRSAAVAPPPQIRTCGVPASGSSGHRFTARIAAQSGRRPATRGGRLTRAH